ncbi:MAG: multidrug transporter, partial [Verrucomicrobia bacterium]|nr:multidrug transporter [Verrucomicrobiota bacterium]
LIGGLTSGAWVSGKLAGRVSSRRAIDFGFLSIGTACALNLAVSFACPKPVLPWSVLPLALHAFGVSLCLPSLTVLALDCFPSQRGAASSVQAFYTLVCNALTAGAVSPLLSSRASWLALGMLGLSTAGFLGWRLHVLNAGQRISTTPAGDQSLDFEVEPPL